MSGLRTSSGARGHLAAVLGDGGAPDAVADPHQLVDRFVQDAPQATAQQDPQRGTVDEIARRARIDKGTVYLHRRT
ncbi:TetR family transcriptional regulator [Streptomyces sp. NBRC 110028]|uniref:TetR family transcriptional regulator n=1 Tax=Streptomyces sp. NBRC 110028 TaxID=1621260 RepID=UPI0006E20690|nr:TetR family transcriptional regulator [Streptomyces sp. NBRC 110028]